MDRLRSPIALGAAVLLATALAATPASALSMFDFAVFSGGGNTTNAATTPETRLGQDAVVFGSIGSNQDVSMVGGSQVTGNVYAGGRFDGGMNIVIGSVSSPSQVIANSNGEVDGDIFGEFHSGSSLAASVGTVSMLLRNDADIFGNVFTKQDLRFNQNNGITITGNATVGQAIQNLGTNVIGGTTTTNSTAGLLSFAGVTLPAPTVFTASALAADDRSCTGGGCVLPLVLAPQAYRDLDIGSNKQLFLTSGTYKFRTINVNSDLELYLDLSSGTPLNILVEGVANFGSDQKVFVRRPGDPPGFYTQFSLLSVADQGLASLVYLETKDRFNVNSATEWVGTVYASVLELNGTDETFVGQNINVWGGLYAFDSVDLRGGSIVNYVRSYLAPQVAAATPAPAALALLGSALIAAAAVTARRRRQPAEKGPSASLAASAARSA